jgi:hypothetical protein
VDSIADGLMASALVDHALVVRRRNDWGTLIGVRAGQDLAGGIGKSATHH